MIPTNKLLVSLGLVLSVHGSSYAQDELLLKDHHHLLHGEVVSSTVDSVTFNHKVGDTSDAQTYEVAVIDPHSFYIIRSRAVGNDAAARVELGKYCEANGLFTRARDQYIQAMKLDKSLDLTADIARAKQGSANDLLAGAKASADQGDHHKAFSQAATVIRRFPDTPAADEARKVSAAAHNTIADNRDAELAAHEARHGNEEIKTVQAEIHRAADSNSKALQEKSTSASQRGFEHSIQEYQGALKKLGDLGTKNADNADLTKEVGDLLAQTESDLIQVYINLGSIYLTQTNYQHALKEANGAIAVDENSSAAKSFRAQVAAASADSEITVYGRGGVIRR